MRGAGDRTHTYRARCPRMQLPTQAEIANRLDELGLNPRDPGNQAMAAAQLQAAQAPSEKRAEEQGLVLLQSSVPLADGRLEITAKFYPTTDTDSAGETAHE